MVEDQTIPNNIFVICWFSVNFVGAQDTNPDMRKYFVSKTINMLVNCNYINYIYKVIL